jgi:hypothetical protein
MEGVFLISLGYLMITSSWEDFSSSTVAIQEAEVKIT